MPFYNYEAADHSGRKVSNSMEAADEQAVKDHLKAQGMIPLSIAIMGERATPKLMGFGRITTRDLQMFTQELGNLLESGMPIDKALYVLSVHSEKPAMRKVLEDTYKDIQRGRSLSQALSRHEAFPRLYVNMIKAGEAGGILDTVVKRLSAFLETSITFQEELKSALVYPLILTVVGSFVVLFIMFFVIPRFAIMFEDMGQTVPGPTQLLLDLSKIVRAYWWAIGAAIPALIVAARSYLATAEGRAAIDALKIKLPLVKELHMKALIARFCRTLGTLLQSGVPILEAIQISRDVIENVAVSSRLEALEDGVRRGRGVAVPLKECGVFPSIVVQMIAVGEEAGRLEQTFISVAERFEGESTRMIKRLMALVAPVLILLMSIIVGFIVVSMLMAVFSINDIPI